MQAVGGGSPGRKRAGPGAHVAWVGLAASVACLLAALALWLTAAGLPWRS